MFPGGRTTDVRFGGALGGGAVVGLLNGDRACAPVEWEKEERRVRRRGGSASFVALPEKRESTYSKHMQRGNVCRRVYLLVRPNSPYPGSEPRRSLARDVQASAPARAPAVGSRLGPLLDIAEGQVRPARLYIVEALRTIPTCCSGLGWFAAQRELRMLLRKYRLWLYSSNGRLRLLGESIVCPDCA